MGESMVEALFAIMLQEDAADARKSELKSMAPQELKVLIASKGIEAGGSKDTMIAAVLAHESKQQERLQIFEHKVDEILAKKKEELESKSNAELKEQCANKGLAVGGGKEERAA